MARDNFDDQPEDQKFYESMANSQNMPFTVAETVSQAASSLRRAATWFGIAFLAVGLLGFIDALTPEGHLFGLFAVDGVHNWVHIGSGLLALAAATSAYTARLYFQILALVYALVTVLGLFAGNGMLLGLMHHNVADIFLHAIIAGMAAYFGFSKSRDVSEMDA